MTKTILIACLALAAAGAVATPARADVKEDYMAACMAAYGEASTDFCTCKTEEAGKQDEDFVRHLIAFYEDPAKFREDVAAGKVPEDIQKTWPTFVMTSMKACRPTDGA